MTPKEKALALVSKMYGATPPRHDPFLVKQDGDIAKKCALLAVDEILRLNHPVVICYSTLEGGEFTEYTQEYYWQEVRKEIENL